MSDESPQRRPRVVLVAMPFMSLDLTPISIGLLQAQLRGAGIHCDAEYLGFELVERIGANNYGILMNEGALFGEWVFAEALHGRPLVDDELAAFEAVNRGWHLWDDRTRAMLREFRRIGTEFVDWCVDARPWGDYDLVGFSSTFHQNLASLALGRRIKERWPHVSLAYGGSNWQGEMGVALHESFPFVDFAATGEADHLIVDLAGASVGAVDPSTIRGIVHRVDGRSVSTGTPAVVDELDPLPVPDYHDWFAQRRRFRSVAALPASIVFESSRGCWWGERFHCTFCGLNAEGMVSRRKSSPRVLDELRTLRERHGINSFMAADTILTVEHLRELVPALAAEKPRFDLFYEVKVTMHAAKVQALADAGITRIQPGIENLSDLVLGLIRKGTTGLANLQFLKWCAEFGIAPNWLFLVGIPGERAEDYAEVADLVEAALHLPAPAAIQGAAIHRFSPFHETPDELGFCKVRPNPAYRLLYEGDDDLLARIAYTFVAEVAPGYDAHACDALVPLLQRWQRDGGAGGLWMRAEGGEVEIVDERPWRGARVVRLDGWQARVYEACDRIRTEAQLRADVPEVAAADLAQFLTTLVDDALAVRSGDRYLALAVHRPARRLAPRRPPIAVLADAGG